MRDYLKLHIAGRGGDGNIALGEIVGKTLARRGYHVCSFRTYPAEIEGGVSQIALAVGTTAVHSPGGGADLAVLLNQEAYAEIGAALPRNAVVLHDAKLCRNVGEHPHYALDALHDARWTFGDPKLKNLILLGALGDMLGLPPEDLLHAARERLHKIEPDVIAKALRHGAERAPADVADFRLASAAGPPRLLLTGNQAIGLGAIRAGCRFVAGYPITPASPLLEFLAKHLPAFGGTVIQAEDEMSAIGSCLGASYAGLKALTPTSGPGFALMSEMINLSVMAELPLVIVDVQRAGPSTGMPSKTEQGDLLHALFGSPGESPRVVLAASGVRDAYVQTQRAFNLAETLQCPVILLSDQSLAYRQETVAADFGRADVELAERARMNGVPPAEFRRYLQTNSGASPAAVPGGRDVPYVATGLEHDERGRENYTAEVHRRMTAKRFRKLAEAARLAADVETDFAKPVAATDGVLGWGSTRGVIWETVSRLAARGQPLARMHLHTLRPLPERQIREFAAGLNRLFVVEENFSGQLARLLRGLVDCEIVPVTKCEGLPFCAAELEAQLPV